MDPSVNLAKYDQETINYMKAAKSMIANNHGMAIDRDPKDIMKENNGKLRDAARIVKRKKGMVRQNTVRNVQMSRIPEQVAQPVQTAQPSDTAMTAQGYDHYMETLMGRSGFPPVAQHNVEPAQELSEIPAEPMQSPEPVQEVPRVPDTPQQPMFAPRVADRVDADRFAPRQMVPQQAQQVPPVVQYPQAMMQDVFQREPEYNQRPLPQAYQQPVAPQTRPEFVATPPRQVVPEPVRDFDAFTDVRGLPSTGAVYGSPISGQAFKMVDLFMLNDLDSENLTSVFSEIFARRLRGVSPEDILSCDEPYLLHWLRASSFPDQPLPGIVWFECPECHKRNEAPQGSDGFPVGFYNLNFRIQGNVNEILAKHAPGYYAFNLPDGRECDVYLRRRYHARLVDEALAEYRKSMGHEMPSYLQEIVKVAVILEIQECEGLNEKINFLSDMNVHVATKMFEEINSASLITQITASMKCPNCGKEVLVHYPFRLEQFIPSL